MEIFERLNCVIIDGKSYVKASDAKLMYDEIERFQEALERIADFDLYGDYSNAYEIPKIARAALKEKE